jgi:nucleoside-diphosphate-sugar epimerase
MARRPFDPASMGLRKTEYRQGDVLDRAAVDALAEEADVFVHLAFIILGGRDETRRVNLIGSRNAFAAAVASRRVKRLVYTSSVAAYGFHEDNPQPLTEDVPVRGTERFYYSAQKAELEAVLDDETTGADLEVYVLRPCIVAGPDALMLIRQLPPVAAPEPYRRLLLRILPETGVPLQLVHHDDVASALVAATRGAAGGRGGVFNLAGEGTITLGDLARELGWQSFPMPSHVVAMAALAAALPLMPAQAQWVNAGRVPVVMDTRKARRELRWRPKYDTREVLRLTVAAAREQGLV